ARVGPAGKSDPAVAGCSAGQGWPNSPGKARVETRFVCRKRGRTTAGTLRPGDTREPGRRRRTHVRLRNRPATRGNGLPAVFISYSHPSPVPGTKTSARPCGGALMISNTPTTVGRQSLEKAPDEALVLGQGLYCRGNQPQAATSPALVRTNADEPIPRRNG